MKIKKSIEIDARTGALTSDTNICPTGYVSSEKISVTAGIYACPFCGSTGMNPDCDFCLIFISMSTSETD